MHAPTVNYPSFLEKKLDFSLVSVTKICSPNILHLKFYSVLHVIAILSLQFHFRGETVFPTYKFPCGLITCNILHL